jgi:hypothetical protein
MLKSVDAVVDANAFLELLKIELAKLKMAHGYPEESLLSQIEKILSGCGVK